MFSYHPMFMGFPRFSGTPSSMCAVDEEGLGRHKKLKRRKIPQRGLGVAELECMIMEQPCKSDSRSRVSSSPSSSISANLNLLPTSLLSNTDHDLSKIPLPMRGKYDEFDLGGDRHRNQAYKRSPPVNANGSTFPLEIPSNQRYPRAEHVCINAWPEDHKFAGVKRPYFYLDNSPGAYPTHKLPPFLTDFKFEQSNIVRDECSSSSTGLRRKGVGWKGKEESCGLDGGFLSLRPAGECSDERLFYEFLPVTGSLSGRVVAGEGSAGSEGEDDDDRKIDLSSRL